MLHRRLSKLQTLLTCTAQLDKAKPEKKEAVSKVGGARGCGQQSPVRVKAQVLQRNMFFPVFVQAESAKEDADRAFRAISDTAKREVSATTAFCRHLAEHVQ